jgi:RNA polymerase sigma factor (TIGR02999 family)
MSEDTIVLNAIEAGDSSAAERLLPLVYAELRQLARAKMAAERPGQTLDATALVHEAYLRLVDNEHPQSWDGRGHFFAAAAEAMRRILIERARRKLSAKCGGDGKRVELDDLCLVDDLQPERLIALDEALSELQAHKAQAAELVKLRYFAGLSHQQAAETMGISRRQADRLWVLARSWLYQQIGPH